ncbi:major facilitator superfamily domain-containing protein [Tribonema minus]|uniref:Lysosomal dipeptide transporter MFSD1 n=1 Tax=Tribonema minus TaxID=303371 RepID=A0A836CI63_9STRA|nr:major facilitator superfamily domain-containing protein [Tribonema minus]
MPTMIQASPGPPGGGGAAASEGEEEELLAQSATQGNGSRAYQSMQGSHTTGTETPTSEAQLSANASPSIHFDERLKDLTSSVQNPVMYFATEDFAMWNPTDHHRPESFREMEETLGEEEVVVSRWPCIACAQRASPRAVRFGILILVSLVPFGSHFVKNSLSSLQVYFMDNPKLNFTGVKYGSIMSAQSLPNIVMPFLGGVILDSKGPRVGIKTFLAIALAGHIAFTLAMGAGNFPLAMGGSVIFGLGTGTLVVAQRAVVSQYFYDKELTFALGVTVAVACVAKSSAKAAAAAIAEAFGGYMAALWCGGLLLGMSFAAGAVYAKVSERAASRAGVEEHGVGHVALTPAAVGLTLRRSTLAFLCLVILHTVFIMVYHLFANFSGHYLVQMYGMTAVQAGLASSVMPLAVVFCAPVAGFVLDKFGGQLYVLLVCNIVTLLAYVLLLKVTGQLLLIGMRTRGHALTA